MGTDNRKKSIMLIFNFFPASIRSSFSFKSFESRSIFFHQMVNAIKYAILAFVPLFPSRRCSQNTLISMNGTVWKMMQVEKNMRPR